MRKILLITSAVVIFPLSSIAQTTCTASPSCTSLGYTESSCPDGNGVKCPWGNKWFCATSETDICSKYGFKYVCSGTGYSGGSGSSCGGKYVKCTCANGYKWENGCVRISPNAVFGQCSGYAANCALGDILFSDGTCNANMVSGKTAIAVVVYKSSDGKCGQALALDWVKAPADSYEWGPVRENISSLPDYPSMYKAFQDFASCENSEKIRAHGDSSIYPAVWAAYNYSTEGTKVGDWCLPAAGIFAVMYDNNSIISEGFNKAGGTAFISNGSWTSSESSDISVWTYARNGDFYLYDTSKSFDEVVYPVIEF